MASLARISLSDDEADRVAAHLGTFLEYVESLASVDTSGIEPTSHAIPLETPLRADRAEPPIDPELAVGNAPVRDGFAFVVPKVIEGEDEGSGS